MMCVDKAPGMSAQSFDTDPLPSGKGIRIGDIDRNRVIDTLSTHYAGGYLCFEEVQERTDRVADARHSDHLNVFFEDLPSTSLIPTTAVGDGDGNGPSAELESVSANQELERIARLVPICEAGAIALRIAMLAVPFLAGALSSWLYLLLIPVLIALALIVDPSAEYKEILRQVKEKRQQVRLAQLRNY